MRTIGEMLESAARSYPAKEAIAFEGSSIPYEEFNRDVNRFANGLKKGGVGRGDIVLVHLANGPEIVTAYYAVVKLGAIIVPLNVMYLEQEIRYIAEDTGAKAIIADVKLLPVSKNVRSGLPGLTSVIVVGEGAPEGTCGYRELIAQGSPELDPCEAGLDDIVSIIYTSGTTGRPKGATQTHRSVLSNVSSFRGFNRLGPDDRMLCALPLFNNFALNVVMMSSIFIGSTLVLVDRFEAEKVLGSMTRHRATYFAGTPTMFIYLLQAYDPSRHDLKALRVVNSGGAHCSSKVVQDTEKTFEVAFLDGYGQTEACGFTTLNRIDGARKPDSVGVPLANISIRIVDDDDVELPPGKVGEIVEKGDVFSVHRYWNRPEINASVYRGGWFHSGDLGYVDEDGDLYVVDRKQDLIITGGANIYPVEVEEVLYTHPAVALAAVVGVPDEVKGELAKAYIVLKKSASATEKEIAEYVGSRIAKYKAPRIVEFVDSLPQGPTGKILKRELKSKLLGTTKKA